ncbi:hypothetical protein P7C73_g2226, partial [Tremellales sp. Uapishka_1]
MAYNGVNNVDQGPLGNSDGIRRASRREGQPDGSKHLKQYLVCGIEGCEKAFNRKDHLTRHQANHGTQKHPCDRCSKSFQRLDLLARHRTRHDVARNRSKSSVSGAPIASVSSLPDSVTPPTGVASQTEPNLFDIPSDRTTPLSPGIRMLPDEALLHPSLSQHRGSSPPSTSTDEMDWLPAPLDVNPPIIDDWEHFLQQLNGTSVEVPADLSWLDAFAPEMHDEGPLSTPLTPQGSLRDGGYHMAVEADRLGSTIEIPNLVSSPAFTCTALQTALDTYWQAFHSQLPMLHRKTFLPSSTRSTKLAIMILIGQYHLPAPVTQFAEMSALIRASLMKEVTPDTTLITFQTLLLCDIYDEYMSSSSAQFMAQCFCPTLVSVARRRSLLVRQGPPPGVFLRDENPQGEALEREWLAWIDEELAVRAAYTMWYIDSQLTAYWGQVCGRRHSVFAVQIRLPCTSLEWEASTAYEWLSAHRAVPPPTHVHSRADNTFLPGIDMAHQPKRALPGFSESVKAALTISQEVDGSASAWTRMLLLHGLNAIVWDVKMHGSIVRHTWKATLHYAMLKLRDPTFSPDTPLMAVKAYRDATALSLFSMYSDVVLLQVFAGANVVSGCRVGTQQYVAARRKLLSWIETEDGRIARWHAGTFLEDVYRDDLVGPSPMTTAWTVYLATIICWVFSVLLTSSAALPLSETPPPQLAIPGALAFLASVTSGKPEDYESTQSSWNKFNLLAAGEFFITSKGSHWGVAMDAAKTLKALMTSMLAA